MFDNVINLSYKKEDNIFTFQMKEIEKIKTLP